MFLNQYSFLFVIVVLLCGALVWAYQGSWSHARVILVGVIVVCASLMLTWTHRTASSGILPDGAAAGQIVLVEYYSDF